VSLQLNTVVKKLENACEDLHVIEKTVTFLLGSDLWTRVTDQLAVPQCVLGFEKAMSVRYLSVIAFLLNGSEGSLVGRDAASLIVF